MMKIKNYVFKQDKVKKIKIIVTAVSLIGVIIGIIAGIVDVLAWNDSQKQEKPFFVFDIKSDKDVRNISIINEGGSIKNVVAEIHYFIDIISAQDEENPSQAVYFLGKENIDYNIEKHMFTYIEQCSFKEEIYCELMTYLKEEKGSIAIVPFIYSYFIVTYEDVNDKQYTEVYLFESGNEVTKKSINDYNRIIDLVNSSKNIHAENIWDFYSANRNNLGLLTESSRTARMEEYDRPKTIEAYLDANYPELDDNQREYFISTYKQFADLI